MVRTTRSKRTKTTTASTVSSNDAKSSTLVQPHLFIHFQTAPSLDRIPDDVFHEVLSYLPTLTRAHVLFGHHLKPPVIPFTASVRTPTLRALSQTSRLLRSRCLVMAWQGIEICGASIPKHTHSFYRVIGESTKAAIRVLETCPHLLPLIQTVTVIFTRFQCAEIIPAFAGCLALLPNLANLQVIYAHSQMTTAIKNGFEGKTFPSVRKIGLPSSAHEIVKSCPNLEEVTCTDDDGSTIIRSLIKANCQQVRILRGFYADVTRLVKLLPNVKHVEVGMHDDIEPLASFTFLDTIEIELFAYSCPDSDIPLREIIPSQVEKAKKVLKENKSQAEKAVLLVKWNNTWPFGQVGFDLSDGYTERDVIKV